MTLSHPVVLMSLLCTLLACQREPAPSAGPLAASHATQTAAVLPRNTTDAALDRFEWPSLHLTTITGDPYDLAEHRGHWVVVNFWATWCAPCRKEMPELSALHARRGDINVIGLAYEDIEVEELSAFLGEYPVTYPIALVDVDAPPPDFATPRGLPTTYLIAPDGQVARQFLGPISAEKIEQVLADHVP